MSGAAGSYVIFRGLCWVSTVSLQSKVMFYSARSLFFVQSLLISLRFLRVIKKIERLWGLHYFQHKSYIHIYWYIYIYYIYKSTKQYEKPMKFHQSKFGWFKQLVFQVPKDIQVLQEIRQNFTDPNPPPTPREPPTRWKRSSLSKYWQE